MPTTVSPTTSRSRVSVGRVLCVGGLAGMVVGVFVIDPVEGAPVVLAATGLVALGAFLGVGGIAGFVGAVCTSLESLSRPM